MNPEELLAMYVDRLNQGDSVDANEVLAAHPELGSSLIEQLQSFRDLSENRPNDRLLGTLGDYNLLRELGRGGMGVVYEAWQGSMARPVALKVLPPGIAADAKAVSRFVREAQVAGKLQHPNVVSVFAMGVESGSPYYAMELVEGETLAQALKRSPADDVDAQESFRIAAAFAGVAEGLQHAHEHGVIHRDLKPSNLIYDGSGRLRILDFGLARLEGQESLTVSGDLVGTPLYMSPEQARAKKIPIDKRTDIYSLGATLYEVLTRRPPFRGKDHRDTLSQIISREPVAPRKLNDRIPKELETIVLKCLRKEPVDRYGTAEALGQDLRRFTRGDAIEARPQAAVERLARRAWKLRWRIASLFAILVLVATMGFLFVSQRREAKLRREEAYEPKVLAAVLKMHSGPWSTTRASGESIDPYRAVSAEQDPETLDANPAVRPVQDAIAELGEAAELVPGRSDAFYQRGRAFLLLGREDDAVRELERALERSARFVPALVLRSIVFERRGQADAARRALETAREAARDGETLEGFGNSIQLRTRGRSQRSVDVLRLVD